MSPSTQILASLASRENGMPVARLFIALGYDKQTRYRHSILSAREPYFRWGRSSPILASLASLFLRWVRSSQFLASLARLFWDEPVFVTISRYAREPFVEMSPFVTISGFAREPFCWDESVRPNFSLRSRAFFEMSPFVPIIGRVQNFTTLRLILFRIRAITAN